jgi:hypothetical protein
VSWQIFAAGQALRLGAQAEVLEPAALRSALLDQSEAVATLYRAKRGFFLMSR